MSTTSTVPTGNTYDKYGSTTPVVRRLMAGFERTLDELFTAAAPTSVLDVGCGEGVLTEQWAARLRPGRVGGVDLDDPKLKRPERGPGPARALAEMARVASRWLLVSVPHEPLWRALNVARGAYVKDFGNTPGHLNHWSRRGFASLLGGYGQVVDARSPFPWTMLLVR